MADKHLEALIIKAAASQPAYGGEDVYVEATEEEQDREELLWMSGVDPNSI